MRKYKTFWPRFWAGVVDSLVLAPIGWLDGYLLEPQFHAGILITWAIISYSIYWVYSVVFHARYGRTLGKMLADIQVVDLSENCIASWRQAILRDSFIILLNLSVLGIMINQVVTGQYIGKSQVVNGPGAWLGYASFGWFCLEIITMMTNAKRRALHDFIAGTVVIRKPFKKL